MEGATHYQLHTGLYREAFAAERESFPSALRRALFWPALAFNARRRAILRAEERVLSTGATELMVFSRSLARTLVERVRVPPARVAVDRPGVDRERFPPPDDAAPGDGALRLLFVAHNFELKGLRTVFAALARAVPDRRPALTVVGGGAVARFRRLAARLGIAERVRFTGALGGQAVAELYRRHDALAHPTFYDPFPLVVVEAMASGLPVVTTKRCGAAEVVPAEEADLLLDDPRDAAGLSAALRRLSDPAFRAAASAAGLRAAAPLSRREHFERVTRWLGLAPSRAPAG